MKPRQKRAVFVVLGLVGVGLAYLLVNSALQSNISYFFSPSQIAEKQILDDQRMRLGDQVVNKDQVIRIGGEVKKDSIKRQEDGLTVTFIITDKVAEVTTSYTGILPDLFKEEQMAVAKGKLDQDVVFYAEEVLAKHDESYVPPEVADAMKEAQEKKASQTQEAAQ
jgi:cytochrome c-type biogenesis protein CcmE